jgi:hypothetical protein
MDCLARVTAVDLQPFQIREHNGRQVVGFSIEGKLFQLFLGKVLGQLGLGNAARIGPRGVEHGPAGAVDRSSVIAGEIANVGRILGTGHIGQAFPTLANADHRPPDFASSIHYGLDHRIQAGHVSATG